MKVKLLEADVVLLIRLGLIGLQVHGVILTAELKLNLLNKPPLTPDVLGDGIFDLIQVVQTQDQHASAAKDNLGLLL